MNLSKKLLLALAGTSLAAPMAASAQELASLSGAAAINEYMQQQDVDRFRAWESKNQVTSVNQFSDVQPTDWAYQALSNLVEKYGCVAGYPNGTYKGGNAMTRFEAAALLNACLDRVTEVTDELQRLMDEFKTELAALTGRVDGLEKKVGKLEAQQFSTTTKLRGEASFVIGGLPNNNATASGARRNKTTFNYDYRLSFDTSYTGKDLLRGRLRSGNFTAPFGSSSNIFNLDKATSTNKDVVIDRLYYTFPVGNEVKLTAGALVRNTELLSFRPSVYNSGLLDFFGLSGATGTYNKATGAGFGFQWKQKVKKGDPYATFDASYIAGGKTFHDSSVGAFNEDSGISVLTQLGFRGQNWGTAIAYRYGGAFSQVGRDGNLASDLGTLSTGQTSNSVSIGAFWQPTDASWMPSISAGYGFSNVSGAVSTSIPNQGNIQSWMVGFQWKDVFQKGNNAGFAFGQAPFASNATAANSSESFLWEFFYKYQVTDKISITPGIFYASSYQAAGGDSTWGGVIQTTFRF
ncbi:iron uptake porin [Synechococcus sp. 8F6]|uniref:iron uptake porin n=1 Tax=Synechococcus sp. 8F6 TaxID=2025606 RepID=UPI000B9828C8|nr:iron uptake porin [Synechococcus sp. 8F6]